MLLSLFFFNFEFPLAPTFKNHLNLSSLYIIMPHKSEVNKAQHTCEYIYCILDP